MTIREYRRWGAIAPSGLRLLGRVFMVCRGFDWTSHSEFPGIEEWFFQRAEAEYGAASKAGW